ncbi:CSC1-like protein RXW8 isoform X1 [Carex littledalei]|uniref:CSC1-like protein RXW8 isoform X1 n=1 Tax=Carex littledalei TaxID=544730 RepID=A0A833Q788_9POAL|nr:CSC1-like protein RXW8 isoform X1 [Carex littledalei]
MDFSALMTSAGINIGLCALFLSLYSILRKQPTNVYVYFGRRIAQDHNRETECFTLDRLLPSPSWIFKAWENTESDILQCGGLDSVVFLRFLVFSIRIFSIAAIVCLFGVLPANYFGRDMLHKRIPFESLEVFTIANVIEGSRWLWVHCLALYIITFSSCVLLYHEYKSISRLRLAYIRNSPHNLSHFTVLLRSIPNSGVEMAGDTIRNFFGNYHGSSYLSHQLIYRTGKVQKLMSSAEKVYRKFVQLKLASCGLNTRQKLYRCGLCGGDKSIPFHFQRNEEDLDEKITDITTADIFQEQEGCLAAFVFFKTRYAAAIVSQLMQSPNPTLWVTDQAPEPRDVYWSNLSISYKCLWFRRVLMLIISVVFMFVFLLPVTFVQSLTQLTQMKKMFPFFRDILKMPMVTKVVTGYLPSVILLLFFYTVPPVMMLLSTVEGSISRSDRKKSACHKILYFTIWNVFFVNVLSGSLLTQLNAMTRPNDLATQLAEAVPKQATFFITYVLTGWVGLCSEIMQIFALIYTFVRRYICQLDDDPQLVPTFPYHTEIPKVLLYSLLGFTCSILAPLILPFLLVYFCLGYVVYRNQILNVYVCKYEMGGKLWPVVHNTTVFSLVLTQIIAIGVFGLKSSKFSSGFTIPLVIGTLLFNEYCRQRFYYVFTSLSVQDLIEMDREDEISGRMEYIHEELLSGYYKFFPAKDSNKSDICNVDDGATTATESNQFSSIFS